MKACSHSAGPAEGSPRCGGGSGVALKGVGGVVGPGGTVEGAKVRAQSALDASGGSVRGDRGMVSDGNGDHAPGWGAKKRLQRWCSGGCGHGGGEMQIIRGGQGSLLQGGACCGWRQ